MAIPFRKSMAILLFAALLTGCGIFDTEGEVVEPPATLTDFEQTLRVEVAWSTDTGDGAEGLELGLVAALAGEKIFAAGHDGRVTAVSATDGSTVWRSDIDLPISGGPGAGAGKVVVGTSTAYLVALADTDGSELWRTRVSSEVLAPPQVSGDTVVVKTVDGRLAAFDAATGKARWRYDSSVPVLSLRGSSGPLLDGEEVIAGFASGKLATLTLREGRLLWEASVALPRGRSELDRMVDIDGEPAVMGNTVFAATYQGRVAAFARQTGTLLWSREMSTHHGLGTGRGRVFIGDAEGTIWALDSSNGAAYWRQQTLRLRPTTAPVFYGGFVVVGDFEGYVHFMDAEDGHLVARYKAGGGAIRAPLRAVGEMLYVLDDAGRLVALKLAS